MSQYFVLCVWLLTGAVGPGLARSFTLVAEDLFSFPHMFSTLQLSLRQQFSRDTRTPYDTSGWHRSQASWLYTVETSDSFPAILILCLRTPRESEGERERAINYLPHFIYYTLTRHGYFLNVIQFLIKLKQYYFIIKNVHRLQNYANPSLIQWRTEL